ncbi:TRAP transporter substrate-binding protein, partial [Acidobacteriota bacterium]
LASVFSFGIGLNHFKVPYGSNVDIRFSTWHPPMSKEVQTVWIPMLKELKNKSKKLIDYRLFSGGALGKGPEHYDIVKNGLSDMGYFTATWTPGRFPLSDVLSLAAWIDGKDVATDIGNATYNRVLTNEFKNVKTIELNGCIQAFMWTKRPVHKLEDVKGLKIRTPGGHQTKYIKTLGAEPIFMPLGDVYLAMETGTIDGIVTCPPLILAFKLFEVAKFGVVTTFGCVTEGVIMNLKRWERMPEELQNLIEDVCHNPYRTSQGLTRDVYAGMIKEIKNNDVELHNLDSNEAERWHDRFRAATKDWVTELESKGLKAKEAVQVFNEECEKRGVEVVAIPKEWK